jgi:hypothetical protein
VKRFWTPSAAFLAQEVHAVVGFLAPTLALALGYPFWLGTVAILLVAAVKEGVVDFYLEGQGFMEGGWLDFAFYVIGAAVASALFYTR